MKLWIILLSFLAMSAPAQPAQLTIHDPWTRATVPQQKAAGVFMQISTDREVRLVAGKSPVAEVEIHEMAIDDKGVMKMREIPGLDIVPGRVMELKPGGYHVMLVGLRQALKGGETVPITLSFEDIKTKTRFNRDIEAKVMPLAGHTSSSGNVPHRH